jgi:hypothetical protein
MSRSDWDIADEGQDYYDRFIAHAASVSSARSSAVADGGLDKTEYDGKDITFYSKNGNTYSVGAF